MRLISKDYGINANYENSCLCIIEDESNKQYAIGLRSIDLKGYLPLAIYDSREDAESEMKDIISAGESGAEKVYYINSTKR